MKQAINLNASSLDSVREKYVLAFGKKDSMNVFANPFQSNDQEEIDKCVTIILNELYGKSLARGIKFLYDNVDEKTKRRFLNTYATPETLARFATSSIEVRAAKPSERLTPNIGHFIITACSADGQRKQLHFTYQVSAVYYLMFLIARRTNTGTLPVIDVGNNKLSFVALYHDAYDVSYKTATQRLFRLLYSMTGGKYRAGCKAQVEYDIRQQLAQAFSTFSDSPIPFGMSSHSHLTVSPDKIIFKDDAESLLRFYFK